MESAKINICLVDDHALFAAGVASLLDRTGMFGMITTFSNGLELIRAIPNPLPHVVLLDLHMPGIDGIDTAKWLNKNYPQIKIVMLSVEKSPSVVQEALDAGADGYLVKEINSSEVIRAVQQVYIHGYYLSAFTTKAMQLARLYPKPKITLTERELEVLGLIIEGHTNLEIASKLSISDKTAQNHRSSIQEKMQVKNVAQMVAFAFRNGFVK